jgi:hypothetical protein
MRRTRLYCRLVLPVVLVTAMPFCCLQAQENPASGSAGLASGNLVVEYRADYFGRYRPNTALDMVQQLPGFQLDDGDQIRGFASAVGNILINDKYTSAKQDLPSAILARIPARQVERIELIRGQVRDIDLQGRALVANVILRNDVPATVRWDAFLENNSAAPLKPGASVSISDVWRDVEYNVGVSAERDSSGRYGSEELFDGNGTLTEQRREDTRESGLKINGVFLNASTWVGDTQVNLNSKFSMYDSEREQISERFRVPVAGAGEQVVIVDEERNKEIELGADAERRLAKDLTGKAIVLFFRQVEDPVSTQTSFDSTGVLQQLRRASTDNQATEGIARVEFDWSGIPNHALQLNLEGAYNELDGSLLQVVDRGAGAVVVDVPGANSVVEEVRGDFLLKDTWTLGQFELDYGLGAESSTISQRGDAELERDFFFVKPHVVLSHAPGQGKQTRLRVAREVAQLDFDDFISATVYEDDDLALGNPNLRPDTTWVAEAGHERRYGELGVVKVTLFHHWIRDVLDLLPLSESFEAPGNIGDGRRWGVELENTVPLEWLGLKGARLDVKLRWQDSSVTDPVTGQSRRLSGDGGDGGYRTLANLGRNLPYYFNIDFRQDFEQAQFAWGWTLAERAARELYKVNEFEYNNEDYAMNTFVETTRWLDTKVRLSVDNIFNYTILRTREVYSGLRDGSPLDFVSDRERHIGYRFVLSMSGNF